MRIFHCLMSRDFAGTERHVAQLAAWQARQGHEVYVLLKEQPAELAARWRAEAGVGAEIEKGVVFRFMPAWWPKRLAGVWSFMLAKRLKPDVGHCHLGRAARYMGRGLQWAGVKVVGTLHLRYRDKDAAHLDALIAVAGWQVPEIGKRYKGLAPVVVWNWVQGGVVKKTVSNAGGYRFLSVGRLVKQKGMDVLVKAFLQAFAGGEDVHLVVVGEGLMRGRLEELAAGDARVQLAGYTDDVDGYYQSADCFVSAARYEPFGLVIPEAMRHGLPLVCTRTEGPKDFLAGYDVTWVDVEDVDGMAAALRQAFGEKRGRVDYDMAPFSTDKAGAAVLAVYARLRA